MEFWMLMFVGVLFLVLITGMGWLQWEIHCNERTYEQRQKILQGIDWRNPEEFKDWDVVDYETHLNALIWFKDPKALYPESLRKYL